MADLPTGTWFGKFELNPMRLSNRDLILVMGIVVAVVITLTALVYKDQVAAAKQGVTAPKKTSWNTTIHNFINAIGKHNSVTHSR